MSATLVSELEESTCRVQPFLDPSQQKLLEYSASSSQASGVYETQPFQPADFTFPKKQCAKQNRAFQAKWFTEFPWLHYNEKDDSVLCFICSQQSAKLNLRAAKNKESAFTSQSFTNWKKALTRFKEHQVSECH